MVSFSFVVHKFVSLFCVLVEMNRVYGMQTDENSVYVPAAKYKNATLQNITNNDLITGENLPSTTATTNQSIITHVTDSSLGQDETVQRNVSSPTAIPSTQRTILSSRSHLATNLSSTLVYNGTTVSPSHGITKHHFSMNILVYVLIPVGSLVVIIISCFLVRHLRRVRRKRRLERELLHQYSYPNSEADDMEEQNIGEIESVVNAHFVTYSDPAAKNIYEDSSEVDLAFGESSKLVVQELPSPPGDLEVSTSFNS